MRKLRVVMSLMLAAMIGFAAYINAGETEKSIVGSEELHWFNVADGQIANPIPEPQTPCLELTGDILCAVGLTESQIIGYDPNGKPIPDPTVDPTDPSEVTQRFTDEN